MKRRLRRLAAPIAVYVVVALVLPIVNGAAQRDGFAHHFAAVVVGVGAVVASILLFGFTVDVALAARRRIANTRPGGRA
jgi:Na+/melibiose symporter-like transporter